MRQIKFRVWNGKTKSWVHGPHERPDMDGVNLFGETILLSNFMDGVGIAELNDCVALQYTGLNDEDGKNIYDGDVVKTIYGGIGRVVFEESIASYRISCNDGKSYPIAGIRFFENDPSKSEITQVVKKVIGNIYENADLFKIN